MNIVTIKELESKVECDENGSAQHVFNVKNITDSDITVKILIDAQGASKGDWISLAGESTLELKVDAIANVPVNIKVPQGTEPGDYSFRLRVFDPDNRTERFTDGEQVYFKVVEQGGEPVKKKCTWCIPAAIAAAVLLVIGLTIAFWPSSSKKSVPYVVGKELSVALETIAKSGITLDMASDIKFVVHKNVGFVVSQSPDPKKDKSVKDKKYSGMAIRVGKASTVTHPTKIILPTKTIMMLQNYPSIKMKNRVRALEEEKSTQ